MGFSAHKNIALITMLLLACLSANIDKYLSGAKWVRMEFLGMSHAENCPHGLYRSVIRNFSFQERTFSFWVVFSVGAFSVILVGSNHVASGSGLSK